MINRIAEFLKMRDESVLPHEVDDEERRGSSREILDLMRPTTNAMDVAGCIYLRERPVDASGTFEAMIDAALKEETP